jgi:hypothetical protein
VDKRGILGHIAGMKRWGAKAAIMLFTVFAIADLVRDFISSDPVHYFAAQPFQLVVVAAIAIIGGFMALAFDQLSPRKKHSLKLSALASAIVCLALFAGYFTLEFVRIPPQQRAAFGMNGFIAVPICALVGILVLFLEFYQIWKKGLPEPHG